MQHADESQKMLSMGGAAPRRHGMTAAVIAVIFVGALAGAWRYMEEPSAPPALSQERAPIAPAESAPDAPLSEEPPLPSVKEETSVLSPDIPTEEMRESISTTELPALEKQDDAVVRPGFIEDLSAWMVRGYQPGASGRGKISATLQEANMRYGVRMSGLAAPGRNAASGRRGILEYAFIPNMVDALYALYADRFMAAMDANAAKPRANGKALTDAQRSDMYSLYAGRLRTLSDVLENLAAMPAAEISSRVQKLQRLSDEVAAADNHYGELVFAQEQAAERGDAEKSAALKSSAQNAARRYQRAVMQREQERRSFASAVRKGADARRMSDDDVIFAARWVERRAKTGNSQFAAVRHAAQALRNLSERFSSAASR